MKGFALNSLKCFSGANFTNDVYHPNIESVGFVESLADHIRQTDIILCPVLRGRSIRKKLLKHWHDSYESLKIWKAKKMAHLVKIGNFQGVRIPESLIQQAHLKGKELKFKLVNDGLLISSGKGRREGWKEAIEQSIAVYGYEAVDEEWLNLPLSSDDELEW